MYIYIYIVEQQVCVAHTLPRMSVFRPCYRYDSYINFKERQQLSYVTRRTVVSSSQWRHIGVEMSPASRLFGQQRTQTENDFPTQRTINVESCVHATMYHDLKHGNNIHGIDQNNYYVIK